MQSGSLPDAVSFLAFLSLSVSVASFGGNQVNPRGDVWFLLLS